MFWCISTRKTVFNSKKIKKEREREKKTASLKKGKIKKDNNQPKKSGWLRMKRNEGNNKLQKWIRPGKKDVTTTDVLQQLFGIQHTNIFKNRHRLNPLTYNLPLGLSEMLYKKHHCIYEYCRSTPWKYRSPRQEGRHRFQRAKLYKIKCKINK